MKRFNLMGLLMVITIILVGCGNSGNDKNNNDDNNSIVVEAKRGFYIDSAVQGVDYECGTYTGTTSADGAFSYQEGEGCRFLVAGVTLRDVPYGELEDGVTIFENNTDNARFLQSIDRDGNASNGIEISPQTRGVIEDERDTVVPTGERLESVVAEIDASDESFRGDVISEEGMELHLLSNLRDLLGGTTYYAYDEREGIPTTYSIIFNADLSSATINQRDYPSGDNEETRVVDIEIISVNTLRLSGDEERDIMVEGSLSTIRILAFPHGQELDILYTSEAAAVAAG